MSVDETVDVVSSNRIASLLTASKLIALKLSASKLIAVCSAADDSTTESL